jgi:hypothetical protein
MEDFNYLKDFLRCDQDGRIFLLNQNSEIVSSVNGNGYKQFRLEGKLWEDHRVVWMLYNKSNIPKGLEIDHEDTDKLNNHPLNLRLVTRNQNCWNRNNYSSNNTGVKGVGWHKGKLRGRIQVNGKQIHVGYFESLEEAKEVMIKTREVLHKEFARHE